MHVDLLSRFLYPRPPPCYTAESFPGELVFVPRSLNPQTASPEDCVPMCLFQCAGARYILIYIHSNFEDLGRCHNFCRRVRTLLQVHVLVPEYPSYGICPGSFCDESGAIESTNLAVRFAHEVLRWPHESIILFGRSIGTGPATSLASAQKFGGLALVCPFQTVTDLVRHHAWPAAYLVTERFPNLVNIAKVKCPCLLIHGPLDQMIPPSHSQNLHAACTSRKMLVSPVNMAHNTDLLADLNAFIIPMRQFFSLPDSCQTPLHVPSWAYDTMLSLAPGPGESEVGPPHAVNCSFLGCSSGCSPASCRDFLEHARTQEAAKGCPQRVPQKVQAYSHSTSPKAAHAGAVEHTSSGSSIGLPKLPKCISPEAEGQSMGGVTSRSAMTRLHSRLSKVIAPQDEPLDFDDLDGDGETLAL